MLRFAPDTPLPPISRHADAYVSPIFHGYAAAIRRVALISPLYYAIIFAD